MINHLKTNLDALKLINPELSKKIKESECPEWIDPINSLTGAKNIIVSYGSHKTTIYEMEKPLEVVEKTVKAINTNKENINVILGFGLGYIIRKIINKMEVDWLLYIDKKKTVTRSLKEFLVLKDKANGGILYRGHHIVVIEPEPYLIRLAFELFDYSEYMRSGALIIATTKEEVLNYLGALENQKSIDQWFVTTYSYTKIRFEYNEICVSAIAYINQLRCNTGTVAGQGSKIADNGIVALPYTIKHRGVKDLFGLFPDKPAICVSTGPSLSRNIHLLQDIQNKVIIIAVGQALRILLAYDIRPDFICTVDFGEVNMGHFKGLMDSDVPLICLDRSYAPLLKQYKGPRFISATPHNPGFEKTANGILKDKGFLEMGGSVAHMALSAAMAMKCDPIILIGQDLAYSSKDNSHCPLADATGKIKINEQGLIEWDVQDQRCHLHGNKKYNMGMQHYTRGYFDGRVLTNLGLTSFISAFENIIAQYHKVYPDRIIYNCTEGGAFIEGAKRISLKQAIDENIKEPINKSILNPLLTLDPEGDNLINKIIPLLEQDVIIMNKIIKHCTQGLNTNRQIKKALDKNMPFKKPLNENEKHSNKAYHESMKLPLVLLSVMGANRQIQSRALNVNGTYQHIVKNKEDFKIRLDRNKIILESALKASRDLKTSYKSTLKLLKKYDKNKNILNPIDENYQINLDDAKDYFEAGNWAHPLLDARRAIKNNRGKAIAEEIELIALDKRNNAIDKAIEEYNNTKEKYKFIKYNNLIEESRALGRKDQDFNKAFDLLQEAIELLSDKKEARWGLATTYHHLGMYDKSLLAYEELIKLFPDIPRFQFEYGQVLIKANKVIEGIREITEAMEKTSEFDTFWPIVGDICFKKPDYENALNAYESYLKRYPFDYKVMFKQKVCLDKLNRIDDVIKLSKKINKIHP